MTESEWLTRSRDSLPLYDLLGFENSERKAQLFACACWRRLWHRLPDDSYRKVIEVSELRADGQADQELVRTVMGSAMTFHFQSAPPETSDLATRSAVYCIHLLGSPDGAGPLSFLKATPGLGARREIEEQEHLRLFRDIFVKPDCPVTITSSVLAWNDGVVARLAQAAYEERHLPSGTLDNCQLAILADALEEAGCTDVDILGHLRGPGPHVRGCWPVDLSLGKS